MQPPGGGDLRVRYPPKPRPNHVHSGGDSRHFLSTHGDLVHVTNSLCPSETATTAPVCPHCGEGLITRRSKVQILPPQPVLPSASPALTGGAVLLRSHFWSTVSFPAQTRFRPPSGS